MTTTTTPTTPTASLRGGSFPCLPGTPLGNSGVERRVGSAGQGVLSQCTSTLLPPPEEFEVAPTELPNQLRRAKKGFVSKAAEKIEQMIPVSDNFGVYRNMLYGCRYIALIMIHLLSATSGVGIALTCVLVGVCIVLTCMYLYKTQPQQVQFDSWIKRHGTKIVIGLLILATFAFSALGMYCSNDIVKKCPEILRALCIATQGLMFFVQGIVWVRGSCLKLSQTNTREEWWRQIIQMFFDLLSSIEGALWVGLGSVDITKQFFDQSSNVGGKLFNAYNMMSNILFWIVFNLSYFGLFGTGLWDWIHQNAFAQEYRSKSSLEDKWAMIKQLCEDKKNSFRLKELHLNEALVDEIKTHKDKQASSTEVTQILAEVERVIIEKMKTSAAKMLIGIMGALCGSLCLYFETTIPEDKIGSLIANAADCALFASINAGYNIWLDALYVSFKEQAEEALVKELERELKQRNRALFDEYRNREFFETIIREQAKKVAEEQIELRLNALRNRSQPDSLNRGEVSQNPEGESLLELQKARVTALLAEKSGGDPSIEQQKEVLRTKQDEFFEKLQEAVASVTAKVHAYLEDRVTAEKQMQQPVKRPADSIINGFNNGFNNGLVSIKSMGRDIVNGFRSTRIQELMTHLSTAAGSVNPFALVS